MLRLNAERRALILPQMNLPYCVSSHGALTCGGRVDENGLGKEG